MHSLPEPSCSSDLEKFFDRVNHVILMDQMAKRIGNRRMLRLIRRYLGAT